MSSRITTVVRNILMEEDQVCLPGLGTLRLSPQPAMISQIEGKALPPSERVNFNANLVLDDGRLQRGLSEALGISLAAAGTELEQFLRDVRESLDAGRSVTLEGVGRLFKHFDGQLRFTAAGENFSKENFGLPAIELKPIVRSEKQRRAAVDPMLAGNEAPPPRAVRSLGSKLAAKMPRLADVLYHPELRKYLWYAVGIIGVFGLLWILFMLGRIIANTQTEKPREPVARVEPAPPPPIEDPIVANPPLTTPAREVAPDAPPRLSDPEPSPAASPERPAADNSPAPTEPSPATPEPARTAPATGSGDNVALIATGLYGSRSNVAKNLRRIEAAGYDSFSRQEGTNTRIGVRLTFRTEAEKQAALANIRRKFSEDAFVFELNGQAVQ
ncbi:hypothetical protein QWY85_16635 [Neolewinella lacunae]|uniref:CCDC81-like prokaryotic HU domain-containing protein n=1 Tax=Neolewinella lacunae TaxID=1517758 RepID=A0A923T7C3_9BACT|nr:hypothetical protein [Neolewinella lacunae]MBC6993429.1 hypothetical protein [Neolewinella lacunae]MDN3636295.1 hypothetical protein [Neolewinella lacunae]